MKKYLAPLLLVALAACGSHKTTTATTNPTFKADVAQAQTIIKGCLTKGDMLTKAGRKAIEGCVAPPGHSHQFVQCVETASTNDKFLTAKQRAVFYQQVAVCLEKNR